MAAVAGLYGLGEDRQHRKKQQQQQQHQKEQLEQKEEQKKIAERKLQLREAQQLRNSLDGYGCKAASFRGEMETETETRRDAAKFRLYASPHRRQPPLHVWIVQRVPCNVEPWSYGAMECVWHCNIIHQAASRASSELNQLVIALKENWHKA
ncbi:hypothetical protein ACLKA6_001223 [Drosophila palustris]